MDDALRRLEDALDSYDLSRALPNFEQILRDADTTIDLFLEDDRADKLLHEAMLARPAGSVEAIESLRTEVELLTLEVATLTERIEQSSANEQVRVSAGRLDAIRARLRELGEIL